MYRNRAGRFPAWLAWGQGVFYLATGLWPLLSIGTFVAVTGPKADVWLVHTVGVLVAVVGVVLLVAARRRRASLEVLVLAVGCALGLAAIDVVYVALGRIPPIYLADAAVEVVLAALWLGFWRVRGLGS